MELNQARSKPNIVDRPVRTAHTFVEHYTPRMGKGTHKFSS